jgi:hypothetical protein
MNFVWQIQVQNLRDDQTFVLMDEVSDVRI